MNTQNESADVRAQHEARIEELFELIEKSESCAERMPLFFEVARLYEQELDDANRAFTALLAADLQEDDAQLRAELDRLAARTGRLVELAECRLRACDADRRMALAANEERLQIAREAAALCVQAGRKAEAIRRYESLRAEIPADVESLRALERLYEEGHPREHLDVLTALAGAIADGPERTALHRRLAAGWEALGERARATEALEWVASTAPDDAVFESLARLYAADQRWLAAVDAISRHAEHATPMRRVALFVQLGMIFEENVEDPWRAIDYYEQADALAPGVEATLAALARLYERTEARERAARRLEEAALIAKTPEARVGRLTRAAELLLVQLDGGADRVAWAERLLRDALALRPGYPPAARALAGLELERGRPQAAADLLAAALGRAADDEERADLLVELGRIEESMGQKERALRWYKDALGVAPHRRDAEVRASELLYALGHDREVLPLLERLCADEPDPAVRADRLVRLGRVLETLGDRTRARAAIDHARAVAPDHFDAKRLEGEMLCAEGRWAEARLVLENVVADEGGRLTPRELATLQVRLGVAALAQADTHAALLALEQALRLDPDHIQAWKRALDLYAEQGRWLDALGAAQRIAVLEPEAKLRARYFHIAARICDEELYDPEEALVLYRRALDEDPSLQQTADALEHLLELRGDQEALLAYYTQRLQGLGPHGGPGDAERQRLWVAVADICDGMGDREAGRIALEVATKIDGTRLELRARLAETCMQSGPDHLDRAIAEHQAILAQRHDEAASYRTLAVLYERVGRPDRAHACQEALTHMAAHGLAKAPMRSSSFEQPSAAVLARRPLSTEDWATLRHPDEDPRLAALFTRIAPLIGALEAGPHRTLGLRPKDAVGADDLRPFAVAAREAARLLGVATPALYVCHEQVQALRFVDARTDTALTPSFLVGVPLLGDRRRVPDLLFVLGTALAQLRPARFLRLVAPDPASVAFVIEAVRGLALEADGRGKAPPSRTLEALRAQLSPLGFDQVVAIGRRLIDDGDESVTLARRWLRAAELTANRAALAITGDLPTALRLMAADDRNGAGTTERLLDLVWSSVTDGFAEVRGRIAGPVARDRTDQAQPWVSVERRASTHAA